MADDVGMLHGGVMQKSSGNWGRGGGSSGRLTIELIGINDRGLVAVRVAGANGRVLWPAGIPDFCLWPIAR